MKHLRKFLRLPAAERRLWITSLFLVGAIRVGLWLLPFRRLRRLAANVATESAAQAQAEWISPARIGRTVTVVSRYVPRATCLTQALAAQTLLGRYGYPATLRLGVTLGETGEFQAHAWVESGGAVVIGGTEAELQKYAPFPALEGEGL